uniref:DUF3616 domain-containing protein n=1 Tax=Candidatus Kentrum sp. LFY TaxID=2126342 RepID=A0A450UDH2_9GAMM|nr:MAG: Protein of unknown function (DUF3616) [Candidatus Kentron sp. LFY]
MKMILKFVFVMALTFAFHLPVVVQAAGIGVEITTELSGSAVVRDGKGLLIAEDELVGTVLLVPEQPKKLHETHGAIPVKIERKRGNIEPKKGRHKLMPVQDIEGIASDGEKDVFFIGSHNPKYDDRDDERYRRFDREFLIKARLKKGKKVGNHEKEDWELKLRGEYRDLLATLEAPFEEEFDIDLFSDDSSPGGCSGNKKSKTLHPDIDLNIEGLAYRRVEENGKKGKLYIGFRAPLTRDNNNAIIAVIDAKKPFKEARDPCKKGDRKVEVKLMEVNLGGAGIRSLDWDTGKKRMLILSGVSGSSEEAGKSTEPSATPRLWKYASSQGDPEEVCHFEKEPKRTPEGVSRWKGKIAIVFDDESKKPSARIRYLIEPAENGGECKFEKP